MNISLQDILAFIRDYGLPLVILLGILWSGYKGKWYFASVVDIRIAQYERMLQEKNADIKDYREANALNAQIAEKALSTAEATKEVLDKIDNSLRNRPPGQRRP